MDALQGAIDVDTNIFFSINRMHNMYFDYFMSAYSGKWVWIPMYAAIIIVEGVMVFLRVMPPIPSDWRFSCSFYSASGGLLFSLWPGRC